MCPAFSTSELVLYFCLIDHLVRSVGVDTEPQATVVSAGSDEHQTRQEAGPIIIINDHENVTLIKKKVEVLENRFNQLTHKTLGFLKKKSEQSSNMLHHDVCTRIAFISGSHRVRHKRFFDQNADNILSAESFEALFLLLCSYWNFNNCFLLEFIITNFCDEELRVMMEQYKEDLFIFRKSTKAVG